ncbi:MAG: DUF4238 domain-containing protein [Chloroflexi bacterium]|nr:DUF4238 domain-containing protein [Chloroflexota bacterium]
MRAENFTHDNHFVPQFYLQHWSQGGKKVYRYDILVPHESIPVWKHSPIKSSAYFRDLYTSIHDQEESDEFEKWIKKEFEDPAKPVLDKVAKDENLSKAEWEKLIRFVALQDVRTPTAYFESAERWRKTLPGLIEDVLQKSIKKLESAAKNRSVIIKKANNQKSFLDEVIKGRIISEEKEGEKDEHQLEATVLAGRQLWLYQQKLLLIKTVKALLGHSWSIFYPSAGAEWFTSDHPVVKLNYYNGTYDFGGGWGRSKTNIFMPLTPTHLLFTQIGDKDIPDRKVLSTEKTMVFQNFIAKRAGMWIYASKPLKEVEQLRPRVVDKDIFDKVLEQQNNWHVNQSDF